MTDKGSGSGINVLKTAAVVAGLILAAAIFMIVRSGSGSAAAEKKVAKELDALKASDYVGSELTDLRAGLSEDGRVDFDEFIDKLKDFDYEITGSSEGGSPDSDYTEVSVRIVTYDFGREYLAAWTDYIRENEDAIDNGSGPADFYEKLFDRLSDLEEKDFMGSVKIIVIDPIDNGELIANIKDNEELQDAVFGGMMSEMKALAGEQSSDNK